LFLIFSKSALAQWDGNTTPTYPELIEIYEKFDKNHKEIELYEMGTSDFGLPIYCCIINGSRDSVKTFEKAKNSTTVLINNAIHAGEPDGVNACILWIEKWIEDGKPLKNLPLIAIIPAYNVGGMMNRNSFSRANQNGPDEYGFRGNAQNLDLNRDFIKADAQNTATFCKIFQALDPDVFVDTHVSNGADYQYTLTYISSMKERLAPSVKNITYDQCIPFLDSNLKKRNWDLFPYVELLGDTPEEGIHAFNDLPRYAMGYASLFNTISFTVETHMLKPFSQRVQATLDFLDVLFNFTSLYAFEIESSRNSAFKEQLNDAYFNYNFELDSIRDSILFKGFEFSNPISEITGQTRLKYHVDRPYEKWIPYRNTYLSTDSIEIPDYFVVGSQCNDILTLLKLNGIQFAKIKKCDFLVLKVQKIVEFESIDKPYEGHFYHSKVDVDIIADTISLKQGDIIISTKQKGRQFLLSTLLPQAEDSYFRWNYFDSYLQQKEYFSAYVFEDRAIEILEQNPELKDALETLKLSDESFRNSPSKQLEFIYKNSPHYENSHNILPIYFYFDKP
jgi:hypothetical protein